LQNIYLIFIYLKGFNFQNKITSKKNVSPWVRFARQFFTGFSLLLWCGSLLCLIIYAFQAKGYDDLRDDNLYLGILLAIVVIVTGIFSYYQVSSSEILFQQMFVF